MILRWVGLSVSGVWLRGLPEGWIVRADLAGNSDENELLPAVSWLSASGQVYSSAAGSSEVLNPGRDTPR